MAIKIPVSAEFDGAGLQQQIKMVNDQIRILGSHANDTGPHGPFFMPSAASDSASAMLAQPLPGASSHGTQCGSPRASCAFSGRHGR